MTRLAWTADAWEPPGTARPDGGTRATTSVSAPPANTGTATAGIWRLYERRHADMVRFAAFLTGDVHAAEDLAQEAFIRVAKAWERLEDEERAEAYLRATVVNLVRSDHRRQQVAERHQPARLSLVTPAGSAEDDALSRVGRQHVLDAVAALPLRQRACVVMRHWMRMTESEIAETLELSIGSVRTHVKRGTDTLKRTLGDQR